jgi:hypothetical protein
LAKFKVGDELDKLMESFGNMAYDAPAIGKGCVYEAAKVMLDGIRENINRLDDVTEAEREGMLNGLGVTKIENRNGSISNSISFDGYNSYVTKKYPKGHANVMIARAIEHGVAWEKQDKFIQRAVKRYRESAVQAVEQVLEKEIKKRIEV